MAERKNRHLLEITRTLLFHMNVPSKFWAYAILIACYLINRFPSSAINYTTPHTNLFPSQPLFSSPAHVFGCVCFVHVYDMPNKLSPRSVKCIFLGYSRTQNGYKCFEPIFGKSYVSADVTLFESTVYFSEKKDHHWTLTYFLHLHLFYL